ncbi:hypothetical protein F5884DRAFT_823763 [Xylogone sp. PMI_703]|nr:hypothetical protein F5884DRAFT_823763 [Xylogone sp. PMI_703]
MEKFDFIIVGELITDLAGASGALIASNLSKSLPAHSVLLLEAGPDTRHMPIRSLCNTYALALTKPELDYGYVTTPQEALNDRELRYMRGRGLGGSTVTNFTAWTIGGKLEFDRWSEVVGDECWRWENVEKVYQKLESYTPNIAQGMEVYVNEEGRGTQGPISVSTYPGSEKEFKSILEAFKERQISSNLKVNRGVSIGMSPLEVTADRTGRVTSASAFLMDPAPNLTIWCNTQVAKIIIEGEVAVGVELTDGRKVLANKEVILSAGTVASAQLLLLSGIGPAAELSPLGISAKKDLPGVGKNLQEHCGARLVARMKAKFSDRLKLQASPEFQKAAQSPFDSEQKPPFDSILTNSVVGFCKAPELYDSAAYKSLDLTTQEFIKHDSVPHVELTLVGPYNFPGDGIPVPGYDFGEDSCLSALGIGMNLQSRGEVRLASNDIKDKPLIDLKLLSHPFDQEVMVAVIRGLRLLLETNAVKRDMIELVFAPKSDSVDDIKDYLMATASAGMHVTGTAAMGKPGDSNACVDKDFRLYGIGRLRVADMSVCPILTKVLTSPSNHTQSTAYLIGQIASEKLVGEYQ